MMVPLKSANLSFFSILVYCYYNSNVHFSTYIFPITSFTSSPYDPLYHSSCILIKLPSSHYKKGVHRYLKPKDSYQGHARKFDKTQCQ